MSGSSFQCPSPCSDTFLLAALPDLCLALRRRREGASRRGAVREGKPSAAGCVAAEQTWSWREEPRRRAPGAARLAVDGLPGAAVTVAQSVGSRLLTLLPCEQMPSELHFWICFPKNPALLHSERTAGLIKQSPGFLGALPSLPCIVI